MNNKQKIIRMGRGGTPCVRLPDNLDPADAVVVSRKLREQQRHDTAEIIRIEREESAATIAELEARDKQVRELVEAVPELAAEIRNLWHDPVERLSIGDANLALATIESLAAQLKETQDD